MKTTDHHRARLLFLPGLLFFCVCSTGAHAIDPIHSMVTGFGGVPLAVVRSGNMAGPPILFIHGSSQGARIWHKQYADATLMDAFQLIAFDLRGHGVSGKPWSENAYSAASYAGDVKAVIEATTSSKVVLVAWSYGGNVAMAYVRKFGLERVAGINITASRSAFGPSTRLAEMTDRERAASDERRASMRSEDILVNAAATRNFVRALTATPLDDDVFADLLMLNMMTPPYVRRAMSTFRPDNRDLAARLTVPVLVSHGAADALVSVRDARRTHRMIDGSRISLYEGAGHMPFYERPERFNRELAEFVRGAQSARRQDDRALRTTQDPAHTAGGSLARHRYRRVSRGSSDA